MTKLAVLSLLLALTSPALAGSIRCTTYEEQTFSRLHTFNRVSMLSGRGGAR